MSELTVGKENAAAKIVDVIHGISQKELPQLPQIGRVLVPPPNLKIKLNNIILDAKDIYLNEYWLPGHHREAKGTIVSETQSRSGGGGYAEFAVHTHEINNPYTDDINYTDTLKIGDLVSVYPMEGDQLYIVESKVVKL